MTAEVGSSATSVKSAVRVMQVIELLTDHPEGLAFPEIRSVLDLPKSSLHGLLRAMTERRHLVLDSATRVYRLGVRYWEAGQAFTRGTDLLRIAHPYLEAVRDTLNETVQLAILDGLENVYVAKVEADHMLQLASRVGTRLPAYATGLGKVLLAYLDQDELDRRLSGVELNRFTKTTITDKHQLRKNLQEVRRGGFAIDDSEHTPGVYCVAVPVFGHDGQCMAAMSSSVPTIRIGSDTRENMLNALQVQARALSAALGYRV